MAVPLRLPVLPGGSGCAKRLAELLLAVLPSAPTTHRMARSLLAAEPAAATAPSTCNGWPAPECAGSVDAVACMDRGDKAAIATMFRPDDADADRTGDRICGGNSCWGGSRRADVVSVLLNSASVASNNELASGEAGMLGGGGGGGSSGDAKYWCMCNGEAR